MYLRFLFTLLSICFCVTSLAQNLSLQLKQAVEKLLNEEDMKYSSFSFKVIDANTGDEVYSYQPKQALPAASTQKIITTLAAYNALGNSYQYQTLFYFLPGSAGAKNTLHIQGSFDPTLGSYRYQSTKADNILEQVKKKLKEKNIKDLSQLQITTNNQNFDANATSSAWLYEDLGNYYGAPCQPLNWRENKYDVFLDAKNIKQQSIIKSMSPAWLSDALIYKNNIYGASAGSGDNSTIYRSGKYAYAEGTIGIDQSNFESSGSINGHTFFTYNLNNYLNDQFPANKVKEPTYQAEPNAKYLIHKHTSVPLDSIAYWFLKKSINLYGESLLRTIAKEKTGNSSYKVGIQELYKFAQKIGVDSNALHLFDGCGLSPQNRITTDALCAFMQYARKQTYYKHFYSCLPVINDISMKSGSIHRVRAYTGYINSKDNNVYIFAIIANNYTCSGKEMQQKLWKVLDVLK